MTKVTYLSTGIRKSGGKWSTILAPFFWWGKGNLGPHVYMLQNQRGNKVILALLLTESSRFQRLVVKGG